MVTMDQDLDQDSRDEDVQDSRDEGVQDSKDEGVNDRWYL